MSAVTSVVALIQQIKLNVDCHIEVKKILDDLEKLSSATERKLSSLKGIIEASAEHCFFFDSIKQNIKDVNDNYSKIRDQIEARCSATNFIRSPNLARQLSSILTYLQSRDDILATVGILVNYLDKNLKGGPLSAAIANVEYYQKDTRALEYLKTDIERKEEDGIEVGVWDPQSKVMSSESQGRKYYGEGLTFYEGRMEKDYACAARLFKAAFGAGTWQAAFYLGEMYYRGTRR